MKRQLQQEVNIDDIERPRRDTLHLLLPEKYYLFLVIILCKKENIK